MAKNTNKSKGTSLTKGPIAIVGMALLAYGITALIFGGHSFDANPLDGTVNGKSWLGLEVNAWSSLLFIGAGALLLFGAPLHWAAKGVSLLVGLALIAAALIALYDKHDVLGIFAANGLTTLVWGAAGLLLVILALLPRVGGNKSGREPAPRQRSRHDSDQGLDGSSRFDRDTSWDEENTGSRRAR
jgi:hypothetical protein